MGLVWASAINSVLTFDYKYSLWRKFPQTYSTKNQLLDCTKTIIVSASILVVLVFKYYTVQKYFF
jgi:hypothetical protein